MSKQPNWHNPDKLPKPLSGRFLTKEEVLGLISQKKIISCFIWDFKGWLDGNWAPNEIDTFRTLEPLGYFLPKKPKPKPKRKVEGPSKAYLDAFNKYYNGSVKDAQTCIASSEKTHHFFNAGRRYERRRLKAGS